MWFLILVGVLACTGKPVTSSCPLEISPPIAVVAHGASVSANCSSTTDQVDGMGWESTQGGVSLTKEVSSLAFDVDSVTDWALKPQCFINLRDGYQCLKILPVTVYKLPDSVSMSLPSVTGPMIEGKEYPIRCDVVNVAPIRNLTVEWHRENVIIQRSTFNETSIEPTNWVPVINWKAHRNDNGTKIWCEAKLNFGAAGQDLPPTKSQPRELITLYPPTFAKPENETLEIPAGSKTILNCTATGNPMPAYSWHFPLTTQMKNKSQNMNQPFLNIELPGNYKCTASNIQGTRTKYFTVNGAPRDRTTLAALLGGIGAAGLVLLIGGLFFVTPEGTFSCNKGSYLRGQPTSSGPV